MGKISNTIAALAATASIAVSGTLPVSTPVEAAADTAVSGVIQFDRSQQRLFDDDSRVIVVCWHRQKGKDFTAACKAVDSAIRTGQNWYIVALTQAQADETFAKVLKVVEAIKELLKLQGRPDDDRFRQVDGAVEESEDYLDHDKEIDQAFPATARILRFPNGAKVVSLPGKNPDALAGRTGNLILTEFGLYPNGGYEHWEVLFPITQRNGYQLVIISTPRGRNTKFYDVFRNEDEFFSVHFCDIVKSVFEDGYQLYDAKRQPLPQSTDEEKNAAIELTRRIYNSPTKWPREYLCQFTGDLSALVTWAELENAAGLENPSGFVYRRFDDQTAVTPDARAVLATMSGTLRGRRLELGWDVARTSHLSVLWINFAPPSKPKRLVGLIVMRNCSYDFMRAVVSSVMDMSFLAVGAGDATGLGNESNETLHKRYGERWTPFNFSASGKRQLASAIKTAFSDGTQTLPPLDGEYKFVATDIYAVQRDDTGANETYEEGKNELMPESHCDIAWAAGLARNVGAVNAKRPLKAPLRQKPRGY